MEATLWSIAGELVAFTRKSTPTVVGDSVVVDGVGKDVALILPEAEILLERNDVATIGLPTESKSMLAAAVDNDEISLVVAYPAFDDEGNPVTK